MNILIVDDSASIRMLTVGIVEDMGHDHLEADCGEKAVELVKAAAHLPDLVILDINMPGIDGYETAMQLKKIAGNHHLPIIFLTGSKDIEVQTKCLEIGDDYIAKPFSADMVYIKVKAHLRVSQLTGDMQKKNQELARYNQRVHMEHDVVKTIFANHFKRQIHQSDNLNYHISPVSIFNGDVFLTAFGPADNFYLCIGDVTGHGLPAAVSAIPIYSVFKTMAAKGLPIGTIASEMNRGLLDLMPENMMLAAVLIEINAQATELSIWSGGMPKMIIDDGKGNIKQFIESQHAPLAAMEEHEFSQNVAVYPVKEGDRLYLYTDGVEESRNSDNQMFSEERLIGLFNGSQSDMFETIVADLEAFTEGSEQDDDITLVEFCCIPNTEYRTPQQDDTPTITIIPWQLHFALGPNEIRCSEPIPQIIKLMSNAMGLNVHQDFISTILTELFSNALEHGLLKLDSKIKHDDEGFLEYYQQRKTNLAALTEGSITIDIEFHPHIDSGLIEMTVTDSGDGYDYENRADTSEENSFGRGMAIVEHLCESITRSNSGRTINIAYQLNRC